MTDGQRQIRSFETYSPAPTFLDDPNFDDDEPGVRDWFSALAFGLGRSSLLLRAVLAVGVVAAGTAIFMVANADDDQTAAPPDEQAPTVADTAPPEPDSDGDAELQSAPADPALGTLVIGGEDPETSVAPLDSNEDQDADETTTTTTAESETTGDSAANQSESSSTVSSTEGTQTTGDRSNDQTTTTRRTTTTQRTTTRPPTTQPPTTRPPTTQPPTTQAPNNCSSGGEFERVFRDDFNGSSVSGSWSLYNSPGNAGFGLRRPSAFSVSDGRLVVTAQMQNGSLVSGGMSHNYTQTYGRYVVRVRTDNDPSKATSGVILTWPESGVHPRDGENNIYETLAHPQSDTRNPFYTFIHKPFGSKSDQEYKQHFADGTQYQTMTMEWTPDRITIIREGPGGSSYRDVWTVNETSADLIPDVPHRMTVQLDAWEHSMGDPVRMEVDFIEIYKYCG